MKRQLFFLAVLLLFLPLAAPAQVPQIINYQGRVAIGGTNFSGTGQFQFALVDGTGAATYWSNGTGVVSLPVTKGLYSVLLGDTNLAGMAAIPLASFANSDVRLRVWFGPQGFALQPFAPDQRLAAVGYAFNAAQAQTALTVAIPPGMALIPAGTFTMGDALDGESDAAPVSTTVSAFYMDVNPVSYSQWLSVYLWATNHGYGFAHVGGGKAANHPVWGVDWYDTVKWCNARSEQAGWTPVYYTDAGLSQVYKIGETDAVYANWAAKGYRLPTEAEWEKAARGGLSGQRFPWGNVITENLANYCGNTGVFTYDAGPNGYNAAFTNGTLPYTSPAGYFAPNTHGLYDMGGNVFAWCWDWYGTPYAGGLDPRGPISATSRVLRGGSWYYFAYDLRCAARHFAVPSYAYIYEGFRCARGP